MKERTINIVFAILSAACGVALLLYGIKEAGVDTDVAVDENVIDTMALIIPGILLIADSAMYLLRSRFRTDLRFLSVPGLIVLIRQVQVRRFRLRCLRQLLIIHEGQHSQ